MLVPDLTAYDPATTVKFGTAGAYPDRRRTIPKAELHHASRFILTAIDPATRQPIINPAALSALELLVVETGAILVGRDPLVALCQHGLNSNAWMGALILALKPIARRTDCAISLVQHNRKGSSAAQDGADAASGAAALINLCRVGRGLLVVPNEDCMPLGIALEEAWRYRSIINTKANLAPIEQRKYIELVPVNMKNGSAEYPNPDWVAVPVPYSPG